MNHRADRDILPEPPDELKRLSDTLSSRIRGEILEPALDDPFVADDAETMADELEDIAEDAVADETAEAAPPADVIRSSTSPAEPGIVDRIIEFATGIYGIIAAAVILVVGALVWFMRRGRDDDIEEWQPIDQDEMAAGALEATETLAAPTGEESIVVVEQESMAATLDETIDAEGPFAGASAEDVTEEVPIMPAPETTGDTLTPPLDTVAPMPS